MPASYRSSEALYDTLPKTPSSLVTAGIPVTDLNAGARCNLDYQTPSMKIRELGESDAAAYRTLRLRALKEHPTAFVSSYEERKEWPLWRFAQRLRGSFDSADSFNLGCFVEGDLIGTVGFFRNEGPKRMHIGKIVGMHVAGEHQGKGYGRALLGAALERARRMPGLAVVHLAVESTNEPAKALYTSFGFETYGVEKRAIFVNGQYFDEDLMALKLN